MFKESGYMDFVLFPPTVIRQDNKIAVVSGRFTGTRWALGPLFLLPTVAFSMPAVNYLH